MLKRPGQNLVELLTKDITPKEGVYGDWLREREFALLVAGSGLGKTWFALFIAYAIASATKFLKWSSPRARKVCYIDGECGEEELQARLRTVNNAAPLEAQGGALHVVTLDDFDGPMPNIANPRDQLVYEQIIGDAEVVIFDSLYSLSRAIDKFDNEFTQWSRIQPWLFKLRQTKTILIIHHTNQAGTMHGSGDKKKQANVVIELKPVVDGEFRNGFACEWRFEKARSLYGESVQPLFVEYETVDGEPVWRHYSLASQTERQIEKLHIRGAKEAEIARQLSIPNFRVRKVIAALKGASGAHVEPKVNHGGYIEEPEDRDEPF